MQLPKYPNPWKTNSTREVYRNPWITVRENQVICPDGSPGIYGVVDCRLATGVLAITENDEAVLVGQYRYATESYSWEIVEGGADPGEDGLTAIKRELQEEAGLAATEWSLLGPPFHLSNCHSSEVAQLYLARGLSAVESSPEHTEDLKILRIPYGELLLGVESGEITDAMTIIAALRFQALQTSKKGR